MFMLAGLIGIMAAGTAAIMTFDFDDGGDEADEAALPEEDTAEVDPGDETSLLDSVSEPIEKDLPEEDPLAEDQIIAGEEGDEEITGGDGDDQINGDKGDDTLAGMLGEDHLYGDEGDDSLMGGAGDDLLHGEAGTDHLEGEDGADTLFGHSGDDLLDGGAGEDSLIGGFGHDALDGGAGDDVLHGREEDDTLIGGAGADVLFGGDGNDLVDGTGDEGAVDFLNGGDGDDVILAGAGDYADGGNGMDSFLLSQWEEGSSETTIMDYNHAEDSLVLLYEDNGGTDPEVEIRTGTDTPGTGAVYVNGALVATVHGGGDLVPADITLLPQGSPGAAEFLRF